MKKVILLMVLWSFYLVVNAQSYVVATNLPHNDTLACLQSISVYREFKKMKLREKAISEWKKVYKNCPEAKKIIYQDGARFLIQDIENENDEQIKKRLVDSLMHLYNRRIKYFGEEAYLSGRKGFDLYRYDKNRTEEAQKLLYYSTEKLKEKSKLSVINSLMAATADLSTQGKTNTEELIDTYLYCYRLLEKKQQMLKDKQKQKKIRWTQNSLKKSFVKSPLAQCKNILPVLNSKYETKRDDIQEVKNINLILQAANCIHSDLFYQTAIQIDKLQPDAETAYLLAGIELEKNHYEKAEIYFQKAIRMQKYAGIKAQYLRDLASMQYLHLNHYEEAQKTFEASLAYTNNPAKTYYLMAEMYAAYRKNFNKKNLEYNALLWLSIDYYLKAKKSNIRIAKKADEKIAYYRNYLPTQEDIFFFGLKPGQNYRLGGWINKTTKVRVR